MFKGILIEKTENGSKAGLSDIDEAQLPEGGVTIDVAYSTLNYKDALAITGTSPIVRSFPMVPGIDLVGKVSQSDHPDFKAGDTALLNGWGVGENHWGGLAQKARIPGDFLIHLPEGVSEEHSMAIGTAGYTAMLCVMALEDHSVTPNSGKILVTGATGGVGSYAISILSHLGYHVTAVSGKTSEREYLTALGAREVIDREAYSQKARPLSKEQWAGAVDVVGGNVLANVCSQMQYGGTVASCGLAGGMDFPATVAPFILRGVTLAGVDSVKCPKPKRTQAWQRLASLIGALSFDRIAHVIELSQAIQKAQDFLEGTIRGRIVVKIGG